MAAFAAASTLPAPSIATFDDDVWEDLLNFVGEEEEELTWTLPLAFAEIVAGDGDGDGDGDGAKTYRRHIDLSRRLQAQEYFHAIRGSSAPSARRSAH